MTTLHYSILINAGRTTVWTTMLEDRTYREWTRPFGNGSYYEGSWKKGSEIRFLASTDDGGEAGMFSRIKENIPHEFISIEHVGMIVNGTVDTTSDEVKKWTSSYENYTFKENGMGTELIVDMQIVEEYVPMMNDTWPAALNALKALCEKPSAHQQQPASRSGKRTG
jgi:hypothetical protein